MTGIDAISFRLPGWLTSFSEKYRETLDITSRMSFVLEAARQNATTRTGGPFAAAIFESESGKLVSLGVNLVQREKLSILHAEIVAMMVAQRSLDTYDLGQEGLPPLELVTSAEPCALCLGAIPWSGLRRVVIGARDQDVRDIGFDEGPKPPDWQGEFERRGIEVITDVHRSYAVDILKAYAAEGGMIYGGRATSHPASRPSPETADDFPR